MPDMTTWWRTQCAGCGLDLLWLADQARHRCAHCGRAATRQAGDGEPLPVHMA